MTLAEYTSKLTIHFNDKRVVEKTHSLVKKNH